MNKYLNTVPNVFVIFFFGSNFLEVPKSIILIKESALWDSNKIFSGFKSLKKHKIKNMKNREKKTDELYSGNDNKLQLIKFVS